MTIPKRRARKIVVNGQAFRWCSNLRGVTGDLTVTVQHESGEGSPLLVKSQNTDRWYRLSIETGAGDKSDLPPPDEIEVVTPAFLRSAILYRQSAGWDAMSKARPFVLRYREGSFHRE